ncbi:hypothetical protein TWF788_010392 [Orbilia oligospora]|uniref:Uncharacterized protein n=1 Tax=Orbilia oligospora TaxID=2813651 RepID=A0A7C8PPR5_ORBOL|nr:hypothetical protein TWF788_010392 [Orbilia oligospora]
MQTLPTQKTKDIPLVPQTEKKINQETLNLLQNISIRSLWGVTANRKKILTKTAKNRVWVSHLEDIGRGSVGSLLAVGMDNSIDVLHEEMLEHLRGEPKYLNRIPGVRNDVLGIQGKDVEVAIMTYQRGAKEGHGCSNTPASGSRNGVGATKTINGVRGPRTQRKVDRGRPRTSEIATTNCSSQKLASAPSEALGQPLKGLERGEESELTDWSTRHSDNPRRTAAARYRASPEIEVSRSSDVDRDTISTGSWGRGSEIRSTDDGDPLPSNKRRAPTKSRQSKRARTGVNTKSTGTSHENQDAAEINGSRTNNTAGDLNAEKMTLRKSSAAREVASSTNTSRGSVASSLLRNQPIQGTPSVESREILNESKALRSLANSHLAASQNSGQKRASLDKKLDAYDERIEKLTREMDEIKDILKEINGTMRTLLAFCKGQDV